MIKDLKLLLTFFFLFIRFAQAFKNHRQNQIRLRSTAFATSVLMGPQPNMYMDKSDEIGARNHVNQKAKRRIKLIAVFHIRGSESYLISN